MWNDDTWKEDQSDGEYSEEEVAPDVFDSDFNESESDDEGDSEEDGSSGSGSGSDES